MIAMGSDLRIEGDCGNHAETARPCFGGGVQLGVAERLALQPSAHLRPSSSKTETYERSGFLAADLRVMGGLLLSVGHEKAAS
jgi:hypothetical protein